MSYYVGIDLGGTNIKVGVVDSAERRIIAKVNVPTRAPRAASEIAAEMAALCERVIAEAKIEYSEVEWIGVATPGIVKCGTVITASNLGWRNEPFSMLLSRITGKEVFLGNDANCAAYAEAIWGVGQGKSTLAMLTLGTGVGGGIVIDGKIWDGFNGFAAELGHTIIETGGRECGCGKRGCLEAYASATALAKETRRIMGLYHDSKLWELCAGEVSSVDAKAAFDAARLRDTAAERVLADFIEKLAVGVSNLINIFQPSVVCIGGGVSAAGDELLLPLRDRVKRLSFGTARLRTEIKIAKYMNDAGIIGAALLGLQKKEEDSMTATERIFSRFATEGEFIDAVSYGNGHINDTYLVRTRVNGGERKYILQKLNKNVFRDPDALMRNFVGVTEFLKKKSDELAQVGQTSLCMVPTLSDEYYLVTEEEDYYRLLDYVEGSVSYDKVETPSQFYDSAVVFGNFQRQLADYPASTLCETIKDFHNTEERYRQLMTAVNADPLGRLSEVMAEVEFAKARENFMGTLNREHAAGRLPLRVTHNDTKLNNILFSAESGKPLCVVDLDTVMPGYSVNDFGDSIRFGATTASEDEADLTKVKFDIELFELYARGFIEGCGDALTEGEINMLPTAAIMMTLECGMRFLADYLQGDTYFKTSRPKHNLDRARNQFKLVSDMEEKFDEMTSIINKYRK